MRAPVIALLVSVLALSACETYRDALARSQSSFEQNQHDRTLALLRDLEPDFTRLSVPEQAQYAYLRGMTDYRAGYRSDARHWLALAKAFDESSPGLLPADWKARTDEALGELDAVVYAEGTSALTVRRPADEGGAAKPATKRDPARTPEQEKPASETPASP